MTDGMMRAAIYTRVSSEEQIKGTSLRTQSERCMDYCQSAGWLVVDVFTDAGVSGAKPESERPALQRLMTAVAAGAVDVVVITKLDRLARSMRHLTPLLGGLDDSGVTLVSIGDSFDSSSPSGRLMRNMLGSMAEWERDVISERTRAGVNAKVRAGGWGGGQNPPFGYKIVGVGREAHLEVEEREAEVVRHAVSLLLDDGLSTLQVAMRLNALGMTPRRATLWTSQNLRHVLRRGQWAGTWTFGKHHAGRGGLVKRSSVPEPIAVSVPPILDAAIAAALKAHLARTRLTRGRAGVHPLSGRLFCPCGQPMTGIARGDRTNRRYRCRHGRHTPGKPFCALPSLLASAVDDAIWELVLDLLAHPDLLMSMAQDQLGLLQGADEFKVDDLQRAEQAVARTKEALAKAAAGCLVMGLDDATSEDTVAHLRELYHAAIQHRSMVAAKQASTDADERRMTSAQELAEVALERLVNADRDMQRAVFALLDIRVKVREHGKQTRVDVEGSVAHDLLLREVKDGLAPGGLATESGLRPGSRHAAASRQAASRRRTGWRRRRDDRRT